MGRQKLARNAPAARDASWDRLALPDLPLELKARVLAHLPLSQQAALAPELGSSWAAAVRLNVRGVAIDLRLHSRASVPATDLSPAVGTLAIVSPAGASLAGSAAAAATQARCWDPEDPRLWARGHAGRSKLRPTAAAWHLRRAAGVLGAGRAAHVVPPARRRSLTLLLVAPEMDTSTSELHRMLETAGAEGLFDTVAMPQGLLRLDGGLNAQLTWANTPGASLPATLQASAPYARLERLALKLGLEDDLAAILSAIQPATLPVLAFLALLAPPATGLAADLAALQHPGLRRLDLRSVQLPAGFASLQQLTGLQCLAVRYEEEDEAPPLNLQGDLSALSSLRQLSALSLDCLASGEGLPSLPQLTSLSVGPQPGARIALRGMPRLRHLAVDLSSGSCGRDLLSAERGSVHVPPAGHGLGSLQQLELRCFVWRHWQVSPSEAGGAGGGVEAGAAGSDGSEGGSEDGDGSSEAGSSEAGSDATGSSASASSSSGASSMEDAGSEGVGWGGEAASSSASEGSAEEVEEDAADVEAGAEAGAGGDQDDAEEGDAEFGEEEEEEEDEELQAAGLLQATWGFMQQGNSSSAGSGEDRQQAHAMAALEQRYIAELLSRLPTLATIQLTDYMGLVDPGSLLLPPGVAPQQGGKPVAVGLPAAAAAAAAVGAAAAAGIPVHAATGGGGGGGGAAKEAAVGGSRAGTPGLPLQQQQQQAGEAGAAASSLAGWQRVVTETPVPGGISQFDLTYSRHVSNSSSHVSNSLGSSR